MLVAFPASHQALENRTKIKTNKKQTSGSVKRLVPSVLRASADCFHASSIRWSFQFSFLQGIEETGIAAGTEPMFVCKRGHIHAAQTRMCIQQHLQGDLKHSWNAAHCFPGTWALICVNSRCVHLGLQSPISQPLVGLVGGGGAEWADREVRNQRRVFYI